MVIAGTAISLCLALLLQRRVVMGAVDDFRRDAVQRGPRAVRVVGRDEHDLDAGMVVTKGTQRRRHDLGRRGLRDAHPDRHDLAARGLLGIGRHCLHLAQRPPRPAADRLARGSQADRRAAPRAVEQRLGIGVFSTAPLAVLVMLCATTAARSVLWTVSYPLAAAAAGRRGIGLGAAVGLLNGIWAATAVLGPLLAGLTAENLGAPAVYGLTAAACAAAVSGVAVAAWRTRAPARSRLGTDTPVRSVSFNTFRTDRGARQYGTRSAR
jgi:hypothetical protein